jgi:hypothetical protein
MNTLTSGQRKLVYGLGILILMGFIIGLGQPSDGSPGSGGKVSRLREEHSLGEATLGNVDPASSTMNLVLLGFRGIAASILWSDAEHYRMTKNWSQLQQSADSITLLQPHFKKVWEYQAWNLGFNVSAECDAVQDRYFWVKQGAKYLQRGTSRNKQFPELYFECGRFLGQKIGRADEKEQFRLFFRRDPDESRWKGKGDGDINPGDKDNFLVARDWYLLANQSIEQDDRDQHKMDLALFLAYPYHSLMDYADAREDDGLFDSLAKDAWADAFQQWTGVYGRKVVAVAGNGTLITLEGSAADLEKMGQKDGQTLKDKLYWQNRYRGTTNYTYWKDRCRAEQEQNMLDARRDFHDGKIAFKVDYEPDKAGKLIERGAKSLQIVVDQFGMNDEGKSILLQSDEQLAEDALKALLILERVREGLPEGDYPLKGLWTDDYFAAKKDSLREVFIRWAGAN